MSVLNAKRMLNSLRETVRQDQSIAHARLDAKIFAIQFELNERPAQDQRSLYEQLLSVYQLANINGHYDAADWILNDGIKPIQIKEQRSKRIEARTARLTEEPRKGNS